MAKKSLLLLNINAPYDIKPATLVLASEQRTSTVHQVLAYETEIVVRDRLADTEERFEMSQENFLNVFNKAHIVIIPDSMFVENSRVFETKSFRTYGHEALQTWYHGGGTVLVQCIEGALAAGKRLNELFQTNWRLCPCDQNNVVPTDLGGEILGPFAPKSCRIDNVPYMVETDEFEGLYKVPLMSREQFETEFRAQDEMFEKLGIQHDSSLTCFDVDKSWEQYVEKYTSRYLIAIHRSAKGTVIWYGDRGQATPLSYVFCKLLNLPRDGRKGAKQGQKQVEEPMVFTMRFLVWFVVTWTAIVIAVLLRFVVFRQRRVHLLMAAEDGEPEL